MTLFIKDRLICEELVSDVFISIWDKRLELDQVENMDSYIFIIAKNKALNYIRKTKVEFTDIDDLDIDVYHSTDNNPERILISKENITALNIAINNLPNRTKLAFVLVKENGLKYKEAAEILGTSVKTIEKQVAFAISSLKETIEKKNQLGD